MLQERTYGFSFWPKVSRQTGAKRGFPILASLTERVPQDRVMINRMDNVCEAVMKGKWPINRRYVLDFPGNLLPGHASTVTAGGAAVGENALQRRSQAELVMAGINTLYSASEDKTLSPQLHVSVFEACLALGPVWGWAAAIAGFSRSIFSYRGPLWLAGAFLTGRLCAAGGRVEPDGASTEEEEEEEDRNRGGAGSQAAEPDGDGGSAEGKPRCPGVPEPGDGPDQGVHTRG